MSIRVRHSAPLRRHPIAAACSSLLLVTGVAQAQQAPAADASQTVVITGIRQSIESSIATKRNSDSIVEAIAAEDLGKLPDSSIAEALSRLPGLTGQRGPDGRTSLISIRGLSPTFAGVLMNGREIVSSNDGRAVEFDQFPSELISQVTIYKSPDASLTGQGLSGTVNIQTVRPLDFGRRTVAVNYRKQRLGVGAVAEGDGSRASLSYIDQFADRKLGVALGFARLDEKGPASFRTDNWGGGTYDNLNVPYNGFGLFSDQTTQKRDGAMAVVQYKPSKNFQTVIDLFYSKFDQTKSTKGFQMPLNDSWAGGDYDKGGHLLNPVVSGSNVTSGKFDNVRAVVRNDVEGTHDKLNTVGWNTQLKMDKLTLNADLGYSQSKRTGGIIETTAGTVQNTLGTAQLDTIAFTDQAQFTPTLNYTDRNIIRLTDVQGWGGGVGSPQAGYSKLPNVKDTAQSLKFSGKMDLDTPIFSAVEGGLHYSDREKTRAFVEGRLVIKGDATGLGSAAIPGTGTLTVGGVSFATFDPTGSVGSIYDVVSKKHPDIFNKDWRVNEKVTTGFVRADIDRQLFGLPVRGNAGLQLVHTQQSSTAFNVDRGTCVNDQLCPAATNSDGTSYNDVLPSMNLAFDLGKDQVLRLALARVMARPTINDMRASTGFGVNTSEGILKGDSGNPKLEPFRANALDVAYEKYFGNKAYVGAAAFYKDLSTYILKQDVVTDFTPYITPSTPLPPGGKVVGLMNKPVNGNGGSISGIELTASLPFGLMFKPLEGFGIQASYSDTSSSVNLPASAFAVDGVSTSKIPLPGLSRRVGSLAVYYERAGFAARVASRYRSSFVGEVADFAGDRRLTYVKAETVTDLQLSYEFQAGPAKGLSILFQANNVTDEPYVRYRDTPANEVERKKFGANYLFGLNFKL